MKQNNKYITIQIITVLILCLFMISTASAQGRINEKNSYEATQRIRYVQEKLDSGTKNAKRWQYTWATLYGVSTVYNGISILGTLNPKDEKEENDHFDYKVNAVKSGLAFGAMIADPLTAYSAAEKLRGMPEKSFAQKLKKMRAAEALLKNCADRETAGRSWKEHAKVVTINLLAGLVIMTDDNRTSDAAVSAVTGIIASEIKIFTTPTQAIDDWNEYNRIFYYEGDYSLRRTKKENRFFVSAIPYGLKCTYLF